MNSLKTSNVLFENDDKLDDFLNDKNVNEDICVSEGSPQLDPSLFDKQRKSEMKSRAYLQEIKYFCTIYAIIMGQLTNSQSLAQMAESDEQISKDEIAQIGKTKHQLSKVYHSLLIDPDQSIVPFLDILLVEIIDNDTAPTSILRLAIKTLIKVFDLIEPSVNLVKHKDDPKSIYDPSNMLQSLMNCQIDDHSNNIDQQELIWINIQQLILNVIKTYITHFNSQSLDLQDLTSFFLKLLEKRGFSIDSHMGQTIHFSEKLKKNTIHLVNILFEHQGYRSQAFDLISKLILENMTEMKKPVELNENQQPVMSDLDKRKKDQKHLKAITFGLKLMDEVFFKFCLDSPQDIVASFIMENINQIVETISLSCEQSDMIIKNQAQMVFHSYFRSILDMKLAVREQLEILYVKCVLKPLIQRIEALKDGQKESTSAQSPVKDQKDKAVNEELSDQEDAEPEDQNTSAANENLVQASTDASEQSRLRSKKIDFNSDLLFQIELQFLEEVLITIKPEDLGMLFLVYDCQHFSESIITKSLNLIVKYSKDDQTKLCLIYSNLFASLSKLDQKHLNKMDTHSVHVSQQRLKYMLENKASQKTLARQCNIKPKLFLNKCQDIYKYIDENAPWDIASKILLYSRELVVENVTEIVGGKEERNKVIFDYFLEKQDFSDCDLEQCLRRTMQTFRLAGVESQVVLRVMEGFSFKYFEHDTKKTFVDRDEAYEMAYLIIVLQTTMHNPNIKKKLQPKDFILQAKSCCPKGYDLLPENYINILYDNVRDEEIFSPLTRNWYQGEFTQGDLTMCDIKLCKLPKGSPGDKIDESQFVNSADLTAKQLFHFNNRIDAIKKEESSNLVVGALRQIIAMLTNRFLKYSDCETIQDSIILQKMLDLNKKVLNFDYTDRILRAVYKIDKQNEPLIKQIIENFDKGSKNTVTLIPQIIFSKGVIASKNGENLNKFGEVNKNDLLEICQASERYFRKQQQESQISIQKQIMTMEGKSQQQIDEAIRKQQQYGILGNKQDGSGDQSGDSQNDDSYSLASIVFNYFGGANEQSEDGQNSEKIQKLKKEQEKLKNEQTNNMKFMNQLFASLINNNSFPVANQAAQPVQENINPNENFDTFVINQIHSLIPKILHVLKDNLQTIVGTQDGLYCLLFARNALTYLIENSKEEINQTSLDLLWQDMHIITSKLTQTQRKVTYLKRSNSSQSLKESIKNQMEESFNSENDDDNLSQLDSSRSEDFGAGNSSGGAQNSAEKPSSHSSDSLRSLNFQKNYKSKSEQRVYTAMCRHLILDIFFEVNKHQIEQMSVVTKSLEDAPVPTLTNQQTKKDIQECMREVQRIFKSIIKGGSKEDSAEGSPQKSIESDQEGQQILDDLHVIICINKLLTCEVTEEGVVKLPILNYNKFHKLLRNLIIFSTQAIEQIQIEVFVQNSDTFIDIINNSLKYICAGVADKEKGGVVQYDQIALIVDLISKITKKSREMRFEVDIPQFLNIFSKIMEIMQTQNQFYLWLQIMKQYQATILLNSNLMNSLNWEQTAKCAFLTYKNSVLQIESEVLGQNQIRSQNILEMFDSLFLALDYNFFVKQMNLRASDLANEQKMNKFGIICKLFLDQTSDVLLYVFSLVIEKKDLDEAASFEVFKTLWFNYLKIQLNYVETQKSLGPKVKENLSRVIEYLVIQKEFGPEEGRQKLWTKSWEVINQFYPDLKNEYGKQLQ